MKKTVLKVNVFIRLTIAGHVLEFSYANCTPAETLQTVNIILK